MAAEAEDTAGRVRGLPRTLPFSFLCGLCASRRDRSVAHILPLAPPGIGDCRKVLLHPGHAHAPAFARQRRSSARYASKASGQ